MLLHCGVRDGSFSKMAHSPCFVETQLETVFLRELRDLCIPVFFV
jgi:hypothetical protein